MKLAFRPIRTTGRSLVQVKNRIPPSPKKKKGIVYEIQCGECKQVYVGETGRRNRSRNASKRSSKVMRRTGLRYTSKRTMISAVLATDTVIATKIIMPVNSCICAMAFVLNYN